MSYIDKYSRIHHKPCINGEPSSNNGWIFSAYAAKVGVPVDMEALAMCSIICERYEPRFHYVRSPEKELPPISRDEILGLSSLDLLSETDLPNWNFSPYAIPKFSPLKLLKQLWQLRPSLLKDKWTYAGFPEFKVTFKHRNYFWQNNLDQIYRFAFSCPLVDRYFILKKWGKFQWFNPAHIFYAAIAQIDKTGTASGIRFLKYGGEKNKLAMIKEFPSDHDIVKAALK